MRTPRRLTTASLTTAATPVVTFAADATPPLAADLDARTIEGLIVPFGQPGATLDGLLTFARGAIFWSPEVRRVKLLREHDQREPIGYALELREEDAGIWGRFSVPEGPEGDRALREVEEGLRDGLSVGVMLDAATHARLRRATPGQAASGSGHLRETSLVTVPAFDDARARPRQLAHAAAPTSTGSGRLTTMTTPLPGTAAAQPTAPAAPAPQAPPQAPAPAQAPAAPAGQSQAPGTPAAAPTTSAAAPTTGGPQVVRAAHAAALTILAEPSTYSFDNTGPSLVRDAYRARMDGDAEAADRVRRFNAELSTGNPASVSAFVRATGALTVGAPLTTAQIESPALTTDVDIPATFLPSAGRADLMLRAVDLGRPISSRLTRVAISNAQPFLVPIEGEFTGVAEHTEGTAHVAEGVLTLADAPVTPRAISGAYRLSRELVDASNPAIDQIAMRAMLRDYRRVSEGRVITALLDVDATPVLNVNTAMELRAALIGAINDDDEIMDFVAVGRDLLAALFADVDTTGRPMLAAGAAAPSPGAPRAGYTGLTVDGTEVLRASRLPADRGLAIRAAGVLLVESAVQQFRFDEIEGPGIIKLALWAYHGVAVLEADAVVEITTAAA